MRVALVQHDVVFEDAPATLAHLAPIVRKAAGDGAQLIVLTEMFTTGFSMAPSKVAEPPATGPGRSFLLELSAETGAAICGSLPVYDEAKGRPVNRFECAFPDGRTVTYEKVHPFSYAGEHQHYAAGCNVVTFDWERTAFTPFICYDLRFADAFWQVAEKTDCYLVVSNWPASRQAHFRALGIARAIENQAYLLATNRVGSGGGVQYAGGSIAVGPFGEILAEAGPGEEVLLVEVGHERVAEVRASFPFLADRRSFSLSPNTQVEGHLHG